MMSDSEEEHMEEIEKDIQEMEFGSRSKVRKMKNGTRGSSKKQMNGNSPREDNKGKKMMPKRKKARV